MPNTKNINQVEQLTDKLARAKAVYFTEYHGLNVEDITELRREFSKKDIEFKVAKNTLIKLAAKNNKLDGLSPYLIGSTAIAISYDDPTGPARILKQFKTESNTAVIQPKMLNYNNKSCFDYAGAAGGYLDKYGYPYCRGRVYD